MRDRGVPGDPTADGHQYVLGRAKYETIEFATTVLYHLVYCMGAMIPSFNESAENLRGILVRILRRAGVYRSSTTVDQWSADVPSNDDLRHDDSRDLRLAWDRWCKAEMAKRLAWSVFEYDNSLSTLTAKRCMVSLQELPERLPCNESLWEAHSALSWASMIRLTGNSLQGNAFRPTLRDVLNGNLEMDSTALWWKRCCAQTIVRLFWDLKETDNSIVSLFSPTSFNASQTAFRKSLCTALERLQDSATTPSRPKELIYVK
jgi:hypothetical protein